MRNLKRFLEISVIAFLCCMNTAQAASTKLSAIANGGAYVTATDQCVAVRNANTDVLTTITISDATISTTDITTNNVSTTKHGFAPKAPNDATKYLDGTGSYSVPAGGSGTTWPATGTVVISNSTSSPAGIAPTNGNCLVGAGGVWTSGSCATTSSAITSSASQAFAVGANGATNPVFNVDASTASVVGGITVKGAATGGTTTITATDSGSNHGLTILAKGTGSLNLDGSTGGLNLRATGNTTRFALNGSGSAATFTPAASASITHVTYTGPADLAMTASTEVFAQNFNNAANTRQHATGSLATQRDFVVQGATDGFVGASTLTDGATFGVVLKNCGTNGTCTNESGILIPTSAITGTVTNSYGINVTAATGATNNYAAKFTGGTIADYTIAGGTKFTTTGCSISSTTGGATAGTFTLGANSCTAVLTLNGATGATAPTGWTCQAHDRTAPTVLIGGESSSTTTTASITIPAGAGATDVISFSCRAY